MMLANLTTTQAGQEALCTEEASVRFLFGAFVSKARPPPRDGYDDPLIYLGKVINNICATKEGRKIMAGDAGDATLTLLCAELADRQRRPDVVSTFRNLCMDQECHTSIVTTDLVDRIARFVYPWAKTPPENRTQLPGTLQEILEADDAFFTSDVSVRLAAAHCVMGLCQSENGCVYLRESGAIEILRAWRLEESDVDTKMTIEAARDEIKDKEVKKPDEDQIATGEAVEQVEKLDGDQARIGESVSVSA
jgi:hypothetical protein